MGKKVFGIDVKDLILIGKGIEGKVFLTPDQKLIKVYKHSNRCKEEYKILTQLKENNHFPNTFEYKGNYLLREYIEGTPVMDYINQNGLSHNLSINLINLAEDFDKLRKIKIDGLAKHVLVQEDESLKVIDPRYRYYDFYWSLLRHLERADVLESFVEILKETRPDLASKWLK